MRHIYLLFALALICLTTWLGFMAPHSTAAPASIEENRLPQQVAGSTLTTPEHNARVSDAYGKLPLQFEINEGQSDARVKFMARGSGYNLFLTGAEAVLALSKPTTADALETKRTEYGISPGRVRSARKTTQTVVRIRLLGANPAPDIKGQDQLPGIVNYFVGNDPAKWRAGIATYARVDYEGVYPGVDVVYYGNQGQLENDFLVAPGVDPAVIALAFDGVKNLAIGKAGDLLLQTRDGRVQMQKPVVYQLVDGARHEVAGNYVLRNRRTVGFEIAAYDHTAPLVIDPVLVYSTFLGGTGQDSGLGIVVDSAGSAYVTGEAGSANFPIQNSNQAFGAFQDVYISKFNPAGTALVYSTFLGGTAGFEHGYAIAVDGAGNAYVGGSTIAPDFPTTANALQPTKLTGSSQDTGFVTKLSSAGTLVYSTYLSGPQTSQVFGIATDGVGNAYVTGRCGSGFPVTASAFSSTTFNTAFLTKLNTNGSGAASLLYSTFLGPTGFAEGRAVAVDATGNAYVTGYTNSTSTNFTSPGAFQTTYGGGFQDAFVAKFNTNLSGAASRIYSTYLGGSGQDFGGKSVPSGSQAIAIDAVGNAYITGQTNSTDFPVANPFQANNAGYYDAFLTKLNPTGSALVYSTYLGGSNTSNSDEGRAVAVNAVGNAYVTGLVQSANFPTANPVVPVSTTGSVFVAKFTPAGGIVYSTRLGTTLSQDSGNGIAVDAAGNAFVTGDARNGFPTTAGAFQTNPAGITDAFVTQIADPTIIGRVVNENGAPISSASVNLNGVPTTTTDANGYFTFGLLTVANNYTVSVSVPNYLFNSQVVNNLQKNVRLDFSPVGVTFTVTGQVKDVSGIGIGGVNVALSGSASGTTTTDNGGNYSFANLLKGGDYTVTPSSGTYSFSPANLTFSNLTSNRIANFVGTQTVVSIGGKVTDGNNIGVNGVTLTLTKNGTAAGTVQTSGLGNYSFGNLAAGANYVVTPAGSFTPSSQTFTSLASNAVANFKTALSIPSQCNTANFASATKISVGSNPQSVAAADFNGDGKLDLAVVNRSSNNVSVLVGNGAGGFGAATNFAVGNEPTAVGVGDFNNDRKLDLVVTNKFSNSLSLLLGNGAGGFAAATNFEVSLKPLSVAVSDFNGDGRLDVVVGYDSLAKVSVLLGNGAGGFAPGTDFATGAGTIGLAVADFNRDGKLDLAVADFDSNIVSVLLGNGAGGFGAATNFAVSTNPASVAAGDFNGDGKLDLAVSNNGSNSVSVLLGDGLGSFGAATNLDVGTGPSQVAVSDINGDGKLDLVVPNSNQGNVSILLGNGAGFLGKTDIPTASQSLSVAVADFSGDGKPDLVVTDLIQSSVAVVLNNGTTCNTQTSLSISGQITDAGSNALSGVTVTLSGPITRVAQTDANGNYAFSSLAPGGNYAVTIQNPYFVFSPSRADFFNLSSNQTANFVAAPVAVPVPTPTLSDDFTSTTRDASKWNLGAQTQPAAAVDPQVTTAQLNGQLVITPLNQATGMHYNGYVGANSFDMRNGSASVQVVKAATGGADTTFAIGSDSNNFFRFLVHTAGAPTGLAPSVKNEYGLEPLDTTTPQLIFQVKVNGVLTSLSIDYDPVAHRYMRFRHEPPAVSPTNGAIVFETSPNNIDFTVRHRILLERGISPLTAELSAGTSSPTNPGPAVFDDLTLVTSTFQFSAGGYTVGEGDGSVLITVTRAGSATDAASVDYATADGIAHQGSRYLNAAGRLTFSPGQTSKTFTVLVLDTDVAEGNQTLDLLLSNPVGAGFNSPGRAVLNIVDNDTLLTPIWQSVALAAGQTDIKTWTTGGRTYAYLKLSFPNAGYRVANFGQAVRSGNDFTADASVERFTGASVQAVTTTAQIYDLGALSPGSYNFTFKNSGTVIKSQAFTVSSTTPPPNPIDTAREFVKQQYRDFLNREADQAGEDFWTDNITKCSDPARRPPGQTEAQCTLRQRETTSGAFFLSPEFQYTGYYVLRMYKGALGRQPKLSEFLPDAQFVGAGILVNSQLSAAKINQNKADFATQFVNCADGAKYRCAEFKVIYDGLNNQQYVDKLFLTTGVNASASDRTALVNGLNGGTETRASVLQKVVDGIVVIGEGNQTFTTTYGQAFYTQESNRAFVQLEYFGYMKRDPDDAGYAFWLGKLNQFNGNFVNAEMVLAFISSPEYRARFGQP